MTITHAKYNADGSVTAGTIEGQTWSGITEASRFWPIVQEWVSAGNVIEPYVEPAAIDAVPAEISDRQFFHILAVDGLITEAEALAAVKTGDAPAAFETFISSLPEDQRFNARMLLEGATTFRRDHPLTEAFGAMYGLTSQQIDELWRRAAAL